MENPKWGTTWWNPTNRPLEIIACSFPSFPHIKSFLWCWWFYLWCNPYCVSSLPPNLHSHNQGFSQPPSLTGTRHGLPMGLSAGTQLLPAGTPFTIRSSKCSQSDLSKDKCYHVYTVHFRLLFNTLLWHSPDFRIEVKVVNVVARSTWSGPAFFSNFIMYNTPHTLHPPFCSIFSLPWLKWLSSSSPLLFFFFFLV